MWSEGTKQFFTNSEGKASICNDEMAAASIAPDAEWPVAAVPRLPVAHTGLHTVDCYFNKKMMHLLQSANYIMCPIPAHWVWNSGYRFIIYP